MPWGMSTMSASCDGGLWGSLLESTAQCIHPWEIQLGHSVDFHQGYAFAENCLQDSCKKPNGVGYRYYPQYTLISSDSPCLAGTSWPCWVRCCWALWTTETQDLLWQQARRGLQESCPVLLLFCSLITP